MANKCYVRSRDDKIALSEAEQVVVTGFSGDEGGENEIQASAGNESAGELISANDEGTSCESN